MSETTSRILIVDDERDHAEVMSEALSRMGHACDVSWSLDEARGKLRKKRYDVVVTDLRMEGRHDGLEVLRETRSFTPPPPVILVTAHADIPTCKQALAEGAYDYIEKPLDLEYFRAQVSRAAERAALQKQNEALTAQVLDGGGFEGIIGRSAAMSRVIQTARQVAASDIAVVIMGESGTGKELIARAIHNNSRRRKARLVALNCAGLSESILEDELFGHVKGAFTGAQTDREGRFEHADGGTLFMDEIGDMPTSMQAKLLRVLENGEVVRLGSNEPVQVDVRLISATNRNLDEMVAEKTFREDLFFRIKGITLHLPALRQRREDIPLLIHHFMKLAAERYHKPVDRISPEAMQKLMSYGWPGNVRQLRNVIENMVVLSHGNELTMDVLPAELNPALMFPSPASPSPSMRLPVKTITATVTDTIAETPELLPAPAHPSVPALPAPADADPYTSSVPVLPARPVWTSPAADDSQFPPLVGMTIEQAERELIRNTLKMVSGNREQAAKILGIGERTLYRKIKEYQLEE